MNYRARVTTPPGGGPSDLTAAFRPRARLLQLLGDQLIGSSRLAIFELVKNAYDADATRVTVTMSNLGTEGASIQVLDNGLGMSLETLETVWLVPGHDHKARQRERGERTDRGRLPLGEKGVGRFAVHKLGNIVEVVTRQAGGDEIAMRINWETLGSSEFLDQASVTARVRPAEVFTGRQYGTLVRIESLRGKGWTRGEVRRLARQITSISSPFSEGTDDFEASIVCPQQPEWLSDLPDTKDLVALAPWEFRFSLRNNQLTWSYAFKEIRGIRLPRRVLKDTSDGVLVDPRDLPAADRQGMEDQKTALSPPHLQEGIGTISGTLYVYDRDPDVINRLGFSSSLRTFLDETSGIRVYRDGIRVYNYGEPGDDWLGLDIRRVNSPSKRISSNIVVGSVELNLDESWGLREKTNREGFVDNDATVRLRALVLGVINVFEAERNKDKTAIRRLTAKSRHDAKASIERPLASIEKAVRNSPQEPAVRPLLEQVQRRYDEMRTIMLRAGMSHVSLVLVFHEVEQGIRLLDQHVKRSSNDPSLVAQARNLVNVIDSFGDLIRHNRPQRHDLRAVARRAIALNSVRLTNHDVELTTDVERPTEAPAHAEISLGLVLGAITNIIDNSLYWLAARWPAHHQGNTREMFVGLDEESFGDRVAIVIADNGPGFEDDLTDATEAFFTRRPDGIGIGLYYVSIIMHALGGELRLLSPGDSYVPERFDGAALALIFPRS